MPGLMATVADSFVIPIMNADLPSRLFEGLNDCMDFSDYPKSYPNYDA